MCYRKIFLLKYLGFFQTSVKKNIFMLLCGILNPRQRSKAVILTTGKEKRDLTESPCRLNRKRYRERKFFGELRPFPTKGEYTPPEGVPA